MKPSHTIVLATRNPGKTREFQTLLGPLGYHVITAAQAGYDAEPEETGTTFRANAEIKARVVFEGTGGRLPVLADDSGLAVDALDGAPGVWSARYAGPGCTDADNNLKLIREMSQVTSTSSVTPRTARYQIALCFLEPGKEPVFFEADCEGAIGFEEKGTGGFGYDTLFIPGTGEGETPAFELRTFAEMSAEEKHPLSHRGKAVTAFLAWLGRR